MSMGDQNEYVISDGDTHSCRAIGVVAYRIACGFCRKRVVCGVASLP